MKVKNSLNSRKGFTLIELLIVIAIIGILAVAFLPNLLRGPIKARDTARIANLNTIRTALANAELQGPVVIQSGCVTAVTFADLLPYMGGEVPTDPSNNAAWTINGVCPGQYAFIKFSINTNYTYGLAARVEQKEKANALCNQFVDKAADINLNRDSKEFPDNGEYCYIQMWN